MPAKPQTTIAADNKTPVFAEQHAADEEWHLPTGSRDGHHVTLGAKADAAATDSTSSWSVVALLKGLWAKIEAVRAALAGTLTVQGTVGLSGRNVTNAAETLTKALVKDTAGNGLDGVVDMAPWGMDDKDNHKVNITRREPVFVQTHNAVTVPANNGVMASALQAATGFSEIAVVMRSDATHSRTVAIDWFIDASTHVGNETVIANASSTTGVGRITVKAPYFKVNLINVDAGAAHVMSSWTTLLP
jgi:hypothetical protein